ncbi:MAG: WecB/TagA/CpsF family glycosyltransferase [Cyanobacteria bacterium KgW148]|nr:WecB/TagA/CpsF family glycosyltransferase [Cyanobacteria bacterium KgW148]
MNKSVISVLGIPVHLAENYLEQVKHMAGGHIVTLNTEMVMLARKNQDLASIITKADLVVPDGAGVVLYGGYRGHKIHRCPGIELAAEMLNLAQQESLPVFFVGASPEVLTRMVDHWQKQLPNLPIAGAENGYFDEITEQQILTKISASKPRFIFVALGVPKQELWIAQHRSVCPDAIWMGVGGSFDVWAGVKQRAPQWMGKIHLEWLFRLMQEPWRWRRMLVLPQFVWQVLWES